MLEFVVLETLVGASFAEVWLFVEVSLSSSAKQIPPPPSAKVLTKRV